jgi:hypothetical protein
MFSDRSLKTKARTYIPALFLNHDCAVDMNSTDRVLNKCSSLREKTLSPAGYTFYLNPAHYIRLKKLGILTHSTLKS